LYLFLVNMEAEYYTWPHSMTHTRSVGFPCTRDRPIAQASCAKQINNERRNMYSPGRIRICSPSKYSIEFLWTRDWPFARASVIHGIQNCYATGGIRNCNPNKWAAANSHGTRGHHIGLCFFTILESLLWIQQERHDHALSRTISFSCLNTSRSVDMIYYAIWYDVIWYMIYDDMMI